MGQPVSQKIFQFRFEYFLLNIGAEIHVGLLSHFFLLVDFLLEQYQPTTKIEDF